MIFQLQTNYFNTINEVPPNSLFKGPYETTQTSMDIQYIPEAIITDIIQSNKFTFTIRAVNNEGEGTVSSGLFETFSWTPWILI